MKNEFLFNDPNIPTNGGLRSVFPMGIESIEELHALESLMRSVNVSNQYDELLIQYKDHTAQLLYWGWIYNKEYVRNGYVASIPKN